MADSDPKLAPHNVESAGFKSGEVKGQYDVSAQAVSYTHLTLPTRYRV